MEKLLQLEQENKPAQVVTADGTLDLPVTPELDRILPESARTGLAPPLRVFVSYSHANYREMEQLKMRLSILQNAGLLDFWHDGQIRPGTDWDTTIHAVERALRETVDRRMALPPAGPTGPG